MGSIFFNSSKVNSFNFFFLFSAEKRKKKLNELTLDELKKIEPKLKEDVLKVFNLKNSINSKKSYGGTSFDNIKKMIMKYKREK